MNPQELVQRVFQGVQRQFDGKIFTRHFDAPGLEIRRDDRLLVRKLSDEIRGEPKTKAFRVAKQLPQSTGIENQFARIGIEPARETRPPLPGPVPVAPQNSTRV